MKSDRLLQPLFSIVFLSAALVASEADAQTRRRETHGPQPRANPAPGTQDDRTQNPANRAGGNPPVRLARQAANQAGQPPREFQLNAKQKEWVEKVLAYWEHRTSKIKTYRCDFKRWEYDPVFGPKDPGVHKTESYGHIRFAAPDRGMIQVARILDYDPEKKKEGTKHPYTERKGEPGEHWVCDGKSVFEFDHRRKLLVETKLPPEMHGQAISESPLPFLFGAKAETIRRRYWVRELPAQGSPKYYQLEALPKHREDAGSFQKVKIFLDRKEFLPVGMQVVELNGKSKSSYQFYDRKENAVADNLKDFWDSFVSPKPPLGWKKVTHNLGQPPQSARPVATRPVPKGGQARKPSTVSRKR